MQLDRNVRPQPRRVETASRDELQELRLVTSGAAGKRDAESAKVQRRLEEHIDQIIEMVANELEPKPGAESTPQTQPDPIPDPNPETLDLSIVLPCCNQEDTIGELVLQAQFAIERLGIRGEVLVADEGSTDDSIELAEQLGARVINAPGREQLQASLMRSKGRLVLLGDASSLERWLPAVRG